MRAAARNIGNNGVNEHEIWSPVGTKNTPDLAQNWALSHVQCRKSTGLLHGHRDLGRERKPLDNLPPRAVPRLLTFPSPGSKMGDKYRPLVLRLPEDTT